MAAAPSHNTYMCTHPSYCPPHMYSHASRRPFLRLAFSKKTLAPIQVADNLLRLSDDTLSFLGTLPPPGPANTVPRG
jgi:hypothetical protein